MRDSDLRLPPAADDWMGLALDEARRAAGWGDVPVGAVVVDSSGRVVGRGRNERELRTDPTAHAEVVALRDAAAARGDWQLTGCTLVVTLEPCVMCAGAILAARLDRVVFGAWDEKAGAVGSLHDLLRDRRHTWTTEVYPGLRAEESTRLLLDFFHARR